MTDLIYALTDNDGAFQQAVDEIHAERIHEFPREVTQKALEAWITSAFDQILLNAKWHLFAPQSQIRDKAFWDTLTRANLSDDEPPHDEDDGLPDNEADADTLRMAGWGTDEDYFYDRG